MKDILDKINGPPESGRFESTVNSALVAETTSPEAKSPETKPDKDQYDSRLDTRVSEANPGSEEDYDIPDVPYLDQRPAAAISEVVLSNLPLDADEQWVHERLREFSVRPSSVTIVAGDRRSSAAHLKFRSQSEAFDLMRQCPSSGSGRKSRFDAFPLTLRYGHLTEDDEPTFPPAHLMKLSDRIEILLTGRSAQRQQTPRRPQPPTPQKSHNFHTNEEPSTKDLSVARARVGDQINASVRKRLFETVFEKLVSSTKLRMVEMDDDDVVDDDDDDETRQRKRSKEQFLPPESTMIPRPPPTKIAKKHNEPPQTTTTNSTERSQHIFTCYTTGPVCIKGQSLIELPAKFVDDNVTRVKRWKNVCPFELMVSETQTETKVVAASGDDVKLIAISRLYQERNCVNLHPQLAPDLYPNVTVVASENAHSIQNVRKKKKKGPKGKNVKLFKETTTDKKENRLLESELADVSRYWDIKNYPRKLEICRSRIHGWGLYAAEDIAKEEIVIEYVGEAVRESMANVREIRYEKRGIGSSYMFRTRGDHIIDATMYGNAARFINHSCQPNCTARVVQVNTEKKILIVSNCAINAGEELTYDYHFAREEIKIPCLCKSVGCRGTLN